MSLLIGVLTVSLSVIIGTVLGMTGAHFRGALDMIGARVVELLQAFPYLIFATLAVVGLLRLGYFTVLEASLSFLAMGIPPSLGLDDQRRPQLALRRLV